MFVDDAIKLAHGLFYNWISHLLYYRQNEDPDLVLQLGLWSSSQMLPSVMETIANSLPKYML